MQVNRIPPTIVLGVIVGLGCGAPQAVATDYFADPNGLTPAQGGDGTIGNPWDLKSALENVSLPIGAGDTLWLRGGLYQPDYVSGPNLIEAIRAGDTNEPVFVSSYPGEWAVIDGRGSGGYPIIDIEGSYIRYLNFELTSSHTDRVTTESGSTPSDIERGCGIATNEPNLPSTPGTGPGTVVAYLVIQNARQGVISQKGAPGVNVYANMCYYNGWDSTADRSHGHGIYPWNDVNDYKFFRENIVFNQFGYGLHAWNMAGNVDYLHFEGNISFNNGILGVTTPTMPTRYASNLLFTSADNTSPIDPALALRVINNFTYYTPGGADQDPESTGGACLRVTSPEDVTITGNYILSSGESGGCVGERLAFKITNATGATSITGNTFIGALDLGGLTLDPNNVHYNPYASDCNDLPTTNRIEIRPVNDYRFNDTYKRAHIAVYNWENSSTITLPAADLNDVLAPGDPYEIYDVQTTTMEEIVTEGPEHALLAGTYAGANLTFNMSVIDVNGVLPVVHDPNDGVIDRPAHTAPGFPALLLIKPGDYDGDGCIDRDDANPLCDNSTATDGDMDCDGDVGLSDFATFAQCFAGASNPPAPGCPCGVDADFDDDGDVDLEDFATLAQNFSGEGSALRSTPAPPDDVASPGDRVTIGIDDTVGSNPNQGTYAENSGEKISYEIYVSIDELGDGPDSQGLAGLAVDILTDTGIQQPKPSYSATSSATYPYLVTDQLWIGGMTPIMTGGFGLNGYSADGNNNANIGSVIGAGVHMKTEWDADVASGTSGLQPRSLHKIGFGTPPGTDVGGNTVPASDARSKWYLLKGEINVPDSPGTYHVSVDVQSLTLIRSGVDLNDDQTEGYLIGVEQNGDGYVEGSFTFTVTDD